MATALVKGKLKAARDAIGAKDWTKAEQSASDALSFESSNYNARVFLAVAKLNLQKFDPSEEAYKTAIDAQPKTLLAWQGLASFYEKTERWTQYIETQCKLADLAKDADDATKCAEALQKLLIIQKEHGSSSDALEALKLFLPESPYYATLSSLPPPDPTQPTATTTYEAQSLIHNSLPILEEIIRSKESEEDAAINREIDRRRQRLSTTTSAEETRKAVMRETMSTSELPELYEKILNSHSASDEVRRATEDKLLRYLHTLLLALPNPFLGGPSAALSENVREQEEKKAKVAKKEKDRIRARIEEMARGMTTLRLPNELAWTIALEWKDMENEDDYDHYLLKRYMELFPESGLARLAHVVLHLPDSLQEGEKEERKLGVDEATAQVDAGFEQAQLTSGRAFVMASSFYLQQKDYEMVIDIAEAGLAHIKAIEADIGRTLTGLKSLLETDLAISLVHHDIPKHHTRALRLLDTLLKRKPDDLRCVLAKAYIYENSERWQEAFDLFAKVQNESKDNKIQFEARCEKAWCLGNVDDKVKDALDELHEVATVMDPDVGIDRIRKAQAWWRYGQCAWKMDTEEHTTAAYDAYVLSIKRDNTYAPAFTALGFYYLQAIDPPNHKTATKCFQKAFELDEREDVAARYLADEFAENGDWDLVEIVARRVVQADVRVAGSVKTTVETPASGSFAVRKHAWAWKAIGAAELKSKKFPQAIVALQYAIRGLPKDVNCWLQLAIAYRGSGKHVAALKTLARVNELDPRNWHARYVIADIQRQIGLYEASIESFEAVQQDKPEELAIQAALAETLLLLAQSQTRTGFTSRAANTLIDCLQKSMDILRGEDGARIAWKLISDALLALGELHIAHEERLRSLLELVLERLVSADIGAKNPLLTVVTAKLLDHKLSTLPLPVACTCLSVLAYSMRMLLHAESDEGAGSAWFDLGHALHRLRPSYDTLGLGHSAEDVAMQSIQCLRSALQKEPLNGQFWNLLGVIAGDSSPKLAQHALIRACELNVRSAVPWTNLGLFYLKHEDFELANKAFLRAQVLDPDYPQAWLGQASLARLHGDLVQASVLTEHAASLSNGSVPDADLTSALTSFEAQRSTVASEGFIRPQFLVSRFLQQRPSSSTARHLNGLLCERLDLKEEAVESLEQAVQLLEAEYEVNESAEIERQFSIANASLGRARLAAGQYDDAVTALDTALGLVGEVHETETYLLKVQCLLSKALASYFLDDLDNSLQSFEDARTALEALNGEDVRVQRLKNQTTLLLAGALYGLGGEDQRAEAERQLLDNIYDATSNTPNVAVITALSAMAIVQDNQELLDAALAEIVKLPIDQQIEQDPQGDIAYILASQHRLQDNDDAAVAIHTHALHAHPTSSYVQEALEQASQQAGGHPNVTLEDLQASIHSKPQMPESWVTLE